MTIDRWLEAEDVQSYELQMEFWLQRLYGKNIYFGKNQMKKYEVLQKAPGVQKLEGIPTEDQLKILIRELENQYLEFKEREIHSDI